MDKSKLKRYTIGQWEKSSPDHRKSAENFKFKKQKQNELVSSQ